MLEFIRPVLSLTKIKISFDVCMSNDIMLDVLLKTIWYNSIYPISRYDSSVKSACRPATVSTFRSLSTSFALVAILLSHGVCGQWNERRAFSNYHTIITSFII